MQSFLGKWSGTVPSQIAKSEGKPFFGKENVIEAVVPENEYQVRLFARIATPGRIPKVH